MGRGKTRSSEEGRRSARDQKTSYPRPWGGRVGDGTGAFAKILNVRGFSVSRESYDLFFFLVGEWAILRKHYLYIEKKSNTTQKRLHSSRNERLSQVKR